MERKEKEAGYVICLTFEFIEADLEFSRENTCAVLSMNVVKNRQNFRFVAGHSHEL